MKIYLHIGLPKTGTTAIQNWCYSNSEVLRQQGFEYPTKHLNPSDPKHSFCLPEFKTGNFSRLADSLESCRYENLILSNEALSIFLHDFEQSNIDRFLKILSGRRLIPVVFFRTGEGWTNSLFRQCVLNPDNDSPINAVGKSFEDFSLSERVVQLSSQQGIAEAVHAKFRVDDIIQVSDSKNSVQDFLHSIGVTSHDCIPRIEKNSSISKSLLPIILKVNTAGFSEESRLAWIALILETFGVQNVNLVHYRVLLENTDHVRAMSEVANDGFLHDIIPNQRLAIQKQLLELGGPVNIDNPRGLRQRVADFFKGR